MAWTLRDDVSVKVLVVNFQNLLKSIGLVFMPGLCVSYMSTVWMDLAVSLVTYRDSCMPQFEVKER